MLLINRFDKCRIFIIIDFDKFPVPEMQRKRFFYGDRLFC